MTYPLPAVKIKQAAHLIRSAKHAVALTGARLNIINRDPTFLDERADIIFRQDLVVVLPRLTTEVIGEQE